VGLLDLELGWFVWIRLFAVFIIWQLITMGAMFRHRMRVTRWSPSHVRLMTAVTWVLVLAEVGAFVSYSTVFVALGMAVFVTTLLLYDRILIAISVRADPRVGLLAEIARIFGELSSADSQADRERIDRDLAALDEWVTPATFELVQLARSRVLAWLDDGPRQASGEARWSARMNNIVASWWEPWQADRLSRILDRLRAWLLKHQDWLALGAGITLGLSTAFNRNLLLAIPFVLVAWLATWGTRRVVWIALIGVSMGLPVAALVLVGRNLGFSTDSVIVTTSAIEILVLGGSWTYFRSGIGLSRAQLQLVGAPETPGADTGPLNLDDYRDRRPSE
jgi:hypothetical protein